ncbi:MAG: hypothetical protein FJX53_09925 [Alphaproteobacteria bacterium]|nr:hypothetical protein [Alphaproteobacteria bacterium]
MAVRYPQIPKVKIRADIALVDGTVLRGHVFLEVTTRVQDMLNAPIPFFPFVDEAGVVRLVHKVAIAQVRPYE